jgi:hypothetical protein
MTVRVVLVAGIGRSGSTLVERAMAAMPGVAGLGEVNHLWHRGIELDERCGCGVAFSACPFWSTVGEKAFGGWHRVDPARMLRLARQVDRVWHIPPLLRRSPGVPRPLAVRSRDDAMTQAMRGYGDHYAALYRAAAEAAGATVVVDSSKHASLGHVLATRDDLDLRILHCVRDARAVCHAWTKTVRRPDDPGRTSYMPRFRPHTMAMRWNAFNLGAELLRRQRVPMFRMRYEDFTTDPATTTRRLAEFLGVPTTPEALGFIGAGVMDLPITHTVAGNPMRFQTGRIPIHPDMAWRAALPTRDRRLVTSITWPLLLRYGYPLNQRNRHRSRSAGE